ncbi:stemmadenine O-acetyltransferase-like [Argentina anserina]|uniref:stemmadenine O-acetyltransferase-like n=1 Tax=Argentina anserina TaxID=57926 RepID=UPI0021766002|nr:stemmadenine O-acetyltransferase-like [Potentilla anserina]
MSLEVKVEVFHNERITPSFLTPHHLKSFSISILDQFSPSIHFPVILFYPNTNDIHEVNNIDHQCLVVERTKLLKRSLSETLSRFYPFAGRIQGQALVCCNDKGAMFLEAQVNCPMSRALDNPDLGFVKELLPNLQYAEGDSGHDLLLVQANCFECGGIAIGFNISHKIIDAFTLSTFLNSWSATCHGLQLPPHQYVGVASRFPGLQSFKPQLRVLKISTERCITRRLLFESSKIESLKTKAASAAVQNPTRVEVVSALIWKCAMKASTSNSDSARPSSSAWLQTVNMRKILAQPSVENLMGNLLGFFPAISRKEEGEVDFQGLVAAMRKGFEELKVKFGTDGIGVDDVSRHLQEYGELLQKDDLECYCSTSWCRLPFHETNFGWGKPLISCPAMVDLKNLTTLMDTSDGSGIAARVTLKEDDMAIFENNEELLAYASVNPGVV